MAITSLSKRVCLVPNVSGVGGMVSFRGKLTQGLSERGIAVSTSLLDAPYSAVLVIGGTRDLPGLWRVKRRGIRIVQRLDGMNWIHHKRHTGVKHFLRAEYGNFILSQIRRRLADSIVYQSEFSKNWWQRVYGNDKIPIKVVYNGVDLERYTPGGTGEPPQDHIRLLLVEGAIAGGYEWGLETAIHLAESLKTAHSHIIELMVVGRISSALQQAALSSTPVTLTFTGQVSQERIPTLDRSAHLLYAADLNAACPNSTIEALACGLPVVAFDTGALPELLQSGAGRCVPYGGDPWKLDPPDIAGLVEAAHDIIHDQATYRLAARQKAVQSFGLDKMVDGYMEALQL